MKATITVVVILAVVAVGGAVYLLTGSYNVSATSPHWDITLKILETVRDRSIAAHSKDIGAPPSLSDAQLMKTGLRHYHSMCRWCHGAPGYSRREFAMGLYPSPPDLVSGQVQQEWNEAQLYWIINNGLKMTGMPSFGVTHSEEELWGVVAFLKGLPDLPVAEYLEMLQASTQQEQQQGHDHDAHTADDRGHEPQN